MTYEYSILLDFENATRQAKLRPLVTADVSCKGATVLVLALIDSGADTCLFNFEVAEALGIDLTQCAQEETVGIAGKKMPVYRTELMIKVDGLKKITLPVGFVDTPTVSGLLGQAGFFDTHTITFK